MEDLNKNKQTSNQMVEALLVEAKDELNSEATKAMVKKIKIKLKEKKAASRILKNIDREIEEMKLELAQELE